MVKYFCDICGAEMSRQDQGRIKVRRGRVSVEIMTALDNTWNNGQNAIDTVRGTTQPEGERWDKPWDLIQQAMQVYGYAAGSTERAGTECNPQHLETVRSELVRGMTLLADAMRLLGEE